MRRHVFAKDELEPRRKREREGETEETCSRLLLSIESSAVYVKRKALAPHTLDLYFTLRARFSAQRYCNYAVKAFAF